MLVYDRDKFMERVDWIIENRCGGNKARFNKAINQRSADYRWRAEKHSPRLEALFKICNEFDVGLLWLLGVEDKKKEKEKTKDFNDTEVKELLQHYKELALHYKGLYEDLQKQLNEVRANPTMGAKAEK